MPQLSPLQKTILALAKVGLAVVLLAVLIFRIQGADGFDRLFNEPKDWRSLGLAQLLVFVAFSLSFVRWYLLVRGLDLTFRISDAFRLGTLGFMLNQVSPGSIGGDLLKAVFIAREQPNKKTEAVTTVLVDRVVGLYAMLLVASVGLAFVGNSIDQDTLIQIAGQSIDPQDLFRSLKLAVWLAAIGGTLGLAFVLSPLSTGKQVRGIADRIPLIGHTITRLIDAAEVYRARRRYLFASLGLALITHCLLISAFWCVSRGLPVDGPTFAQNASIVPIALVAGALPLTPGGLGTLELGVESLYIALGAGKGDGTIVALAYRAMTYIFAGIGAFYYFSARKNVDEMLHEAEVLSEEAS